MQFVSRQIRDVFDLIFVVITVAVLLGIAVNSYSAYIMRTHVAGALSIATTHKKNLVEDFYLTGEMPAGDPGDLGLVTNDNALDVVDFGRGGITFAIQEGTTSYLFSFRAALPDSVPRAPTLWLCGYAEAPDGYHATTENRTNIPLEYLPAECRGYDR